MASSTGIFLVLEGSDGSGKGTQFKLLEKRLTAAGYDVEVFDFPRYEEPSSHFVRRYLNGDYGSAGKVNAYTASLFYALDRYEAAPQIKKALNKGKVVLANRYVGSNMAHQGAKITDSMQQRSFFIWADSLEFQLLGIPRPTASVFLRVPAEISQKLISQKAERSYTKQTHDQHEADLNHLRRAVATYDLLCQLFPNDFKAIECTDQGKLLDIPAISNRIWDLIQPMLPPKPAKAGRPPSVNLSEMSKPKTASSQGSNEKQISISAQISWLLISELSSDFQQFINVGEDWSGSSYHYYVPGSLNKKAQHNFTRQMDELVNDYKALASTATKAGLEQDAIRRAEPMAALIKCDFNLNATDANRLIDKLAEIGSPEAASLAGKINTAGQQIDAGQFKERVFEAGNSKVEAVGSVLDKLAKEFLPHNLPAADQQVQLVEATPRNEFRALAESLYSISDLPRERVEAEIEKWDYQQKYEALCDAASQNRGGMLEQISYKFDLVLSQDDIAQLQQKMPRAKITLQPLTPRYGFDTPETIEQAGLDDKFAACFDQSLQIFSSLQAAGNEKDAGYATLLGHKRRAQLSINAEELAKADTRIKPALLEKIAEVHPIIAECLRGEVSQTQAKSPGQPSIKSRPPKRRRSTKR